MNINRDIVQMIADRNHVEVAKIEKILNTFYTEEELRGMNLVTQLRFIGRVKGVKAPTSKNMDQLVSGILAIQEGRLEPEYTSKGRKVKHVVSTLGETDTNWDVVYDDIIKKSKNDQEPVLASPKGEVVQKVKIESGSELIPDDTEDVDGNADNNSDADSLNTTIQTTGVLDILSDGFGFLRTFNYHQSKNDVFVSTQQIKRFNLRQGDKIYCTARCFSKTKAPSLIFIHSINDVPCDKVGRRPHFSDFVATYPKERIMLSLGAEKYDYSLRAIDIVSPIGKGQRGIIVAPPKTGKTTLIKKIAQSVVKTYGDKIKVFIVLIAERPEEVTDMQESVPGAEVVYSTFDQTPFHHTSVAEMVLNNSKHRVEQGQDVLILLDSITRLARAYNKTAEVTGRTLSGGLDIAALEAPKSFFGSARRVLDGGSLTILATALIETGSRMDDIIYEEFKGTGNMEIHLDRELADRRIFPSIDLRKSGTRREDLLLTQKELEGMWIIRRKLADTQNKDACTQLLDMLTCTANNDEFFDTLKLMK